jgi:hypothetical protein
MPGQLRSQHEEIHLSGQSFDFFYQNIITCICVLFGNLAFAKPLVFAANLSVIIKMQLTPNSFSVKCKLESGGGWCRYVQVSLSNVYHSHSF